MKALSTGCISEDVPGSVDSGRADQSSGAFIPQILRATSKICHVPDPRYGVEAKLGTAQLIKGCGRQELN